VSAGTIDVRTPPRPQQVLRLRPARVEHVLGTAVADSEAADILTRLGCGVETSGDDYLVRVPTFRGDLEREIDLIEEIARVHGLENIPSTLPARRSGWGGLTAAQAGMRKIEDLLVGAGLFQVIPYSFTDDQWPERLRLAHDDPRRASVRIANPLSSDQAVMRSMLLPGLLATAQSNGAVREERVHVFEVGRVFRSTDAPLPEEKTHVGILVSGAWEEESWLRSGISVDYYLVKGLVERLCAGLGCALEYVAASEPFLHPGRSATVHDREGRAVGWLGEIHPLVLQDYDLHPPVVAAELDAELLLGASVARRTFLEVPAYPAVRQDLALVVDRGVPAAKVVESLSRAGGGLLKDVRVFDVYEGDQVGEGKKSLAVRLSFQAPDRTLSDAEVNELRRQMLERVRTELGAGLRA